VSVINKKILILVGLLILIFLTGCLNVENETNIQNEDKEVIETFFNSYFEQFAYSEEEWEYLVKYVESNANILTLIDKIDSNNDEQILDNDDWIVQWKETLTEKEIKRLVSNRLLPNFCLREYSGTEYSIEKIEVADDADFYSINIQFKNIGYYDIDENINILLRMVDTEQGRRIDYIELEDFDSIFK